ncbi:MULTISPECIES: Lrp/AsnC family transcriptional regulator [Reichenbachiella]|uniref:Lrp/AsnC family transcriptional regulator n=1 Tax=Reichenbachiella TaxID=156993 RepID=UPI000E6CF133|nr:MULTISPECIES: Lrp/AsnC family transcriptional regulator [Reichenbachiella]MBU2912521.1 Lrp/AsnC family transcriptional regulator [Reichenbachiella agariperforans]RJE72619.1 AsnC family transcriptional regulator [Reichenbachiella sp. MSK19-1]
MALLDEVDVKILSLLQAEGRITNKALAEKMGLSTTPVFDRVKRLEKEGVIKQYVALLDQRKIDKKLTVFVFISLKNHTRSYLDKFIGEMNEYPEVQECYHIAGDFDYMLKIVTRDIESFQSFILAKLSVNSNIAHVKSQFVLSKNKHTTAFKID